MILFYDSEFTGLHKNTTLISLGIVDEDGNTFYAEFNDYDKTQVNQWIKDNVISNLMYNDVDYFRLDDNKSIKIKGSKNDIKEALLLWIGKYDKVQFVSDVCHFDFVLLIDLFGDAFSIPKNMSPYCHDINQDISKYNSISDWEAFDYSRELLAYGDSVNFSNKHNSLFDAITIKSIWDKYKYNVR